MSLCPHCKKTSLELVNKPSKRSEFFSHFCFEIMMGILIMSFAAWESSRITAAVLIAIPISAMIYFIFRKKENPLSKCLSCCKIFDQETINKSQRYV